MLNKTNTKQNLINKDRMIKYKKLQEYETTLYVVDSKSQGITTNDWLSGGLITLVREKFSVFIKENILTTDKLGNQIVIIMKNKIMEQLPLLIYTKSQQHYLIVLLLPYSI